MTNEQIEALEDAGFTVKEWRGERWYLKRDGRDFGYLVKGDNGSTGQQEHIHKRAGEISAILRGVQ